MTVSEKTAYLKGLVEGLGIDDSTKEGKVIKYICEVLDDLALSVCDLEDETATLNDYIEEIDEDLGFLEEDYYDDNCDCDCDCDDDCDCGCDCDDDCDCGCDCDDDCDDDFEYYEVDCPFCGEKIYFDETIDPEKVICPACNKEFSNDNE